MDIQDLRQTVMKLVQTKPFNTTKVHSGPICHFCTKSNFLLQKLSNYKIWFKMGSQKDFLVMKLCQPQ